MDKKGLVIGWVAVSVLWLLYWLAMTTTLGVEAIGELVASMNHGMLVAALCVSVPVTLFFIGMAGAWLKRVVSSGKS
ncbi:MAG: hypothetical protein NT115_02965 [Proteobacteria bacterium]|nr:hypothetical protein [Pseudomonadota bacterium]